MDIRLQNLSFEHFDGHVFDNFFNSISVVADQQEVGVLLFGLCYESGCEITKRLVFEEESVL